MIETVQKHPLLINQTQMELDPGLTLEKILQEIGCDCDLILGALVNGAVRELTYRPNAGDEIVWLDLTTNIGSKIYARGLLHLLARAFDEVIGIEHLRIEHSINEAVYCEVQGAEISPFDVERIAQLMHGYVQQDDKFLRATLPLQEAITLFTQLGRTDKARLLHYCPLQTIDVYSCGGYTDSYFSYMPPSAGYIKRFALECDNAGFVLLSPSKNDPTAPLFYNRFPKIAYIFRQSEKWADILHCKDIGQLNEIVKSDHLEDFIVMNEALHEKEISSFCQNIQENKARAVFVAGPSSSGKTTFTQRLKVQLRVLGYQPVLISLDNYYIDRDLLPIEEDGLPDLESIRSLNVALFNEQICALLDGQTVQIPRFDFTNGTSIPNSGNWMRLEENSILLIEGIHGLNPEMSKHIDAKDKFKIFISAQTQLNLDALVRVPTTDMRLLRRIVRDNVVRNTSVWRTMEMWKKVRSGEDKYIFPYEEQCNVMFNSTLLYELPFLKKSAYPLLAQITPEQAEYHEARRLMNMLDFCVDIDCDALVPRISILREFIGNGCFER